MLKEYYTELVFVKVYGAPGNDSEESIPPAYVSRRAVTTYNDKGMQYRGPAGNRFLGFLKVHKHEIIFFFFTKIKSLYSLGKFKKKNRFFSFDFRQNFEVRTFSR